MESRKLSDYSLARSLIQKAVRRGHVGALGRASAFILKREGGRSWLRTRSRLIAFEESWPIAGELLAGPGGIEDPAPLLTCALHSKQKDATGLGALVRAWVEGEERALDVAPDRRSVKIVTEGMNRPAAFWEWAKTQAGSREARLVIAAAQQAARVAYSPHDVAMVYSAAYLAAQGPLPVLHKVEPEVGPFPYWVAADKHTSMGAQVLVDVRMALGVTYDAAASMLFLLDGAAVNALEESPWWTAARQLKFLQIGIREERAVEIMEHLRPMIVKIVGDRVERELQEEDEGTQISMFTQ
jgi:hypothetical protein